MPMFSKKCRIYLTQFIFIKLFALEKCGLVENNYTQYHLKTM